MIGDASRAARGPTAALVAACVLALGAAHAGVTVGVVAGDLPGSGAATTAASKPPDVVLADDASFGRSTITGSSSSRTIPTGTAGSR